MEAANASAENQIETGCVGPAGLSPDGNLAKPKQSEMTAGSDAWGATARELARSWYPEMSDPDLDQVCRASLELAMGGARNERELLTSFEYELHRVVEERAVLGTVDSVLPGASVAQAPEALSSFSAQASTELPTDPPQRAPEHPSPDGPVMPAVAQSPLLAHQAEPAPVAESIAPLEDSEPARSASGLADTALLTAILRFDDGLSAAEVQRRMGLDESTYARVVVGFVQQAENRIGDHEDLHVDRRDVASYLAGVASRHQAARVERYVTECTGCAAYLADLIDATRVVVSELAVANSPKPQQRPTAAADTTPLRIDANDLKKYVAPARVRHPHPQPARRPARQRERRLNPHGRLVLLGGRVGVTAMTALLAGGAVEGVAQVTGHGSVLTGFFEKITHLAGASPASSRHAAAPATERATNGVETATTPTYSALSAGLPWPSEGALSANSRFVDQLAPGIAAMAGALLPGSGGDLGVLLTQLNNAHGLPASTLAAASDNGRPATASVPIAAATDAVSAVNPVADSVQSGGAHSLDLGIINVSQGSAAGDPVNSTSQAAGPAQGIVPTGGPAQPSDGGRRLDVGVLNVTLGSNASEKRNGGLNVSVPGVVGINVPDLLAPAPTSAAPSTSTSSTAPTGAAPSQSASANPAPQPTPVASSSALPPAPSTTAPATGSTSSNAPLPVTTPLPSASAVVPAINPPPPASSTTPPPAPAAPTPAVASPAPPVASPAPPPPPPPPVITSSSVTSEAASATSTPPPLPINPPAGIATGG